MKKNPLVGSLVRFSLAILVAGMLAPFGSAQEPGEQLTPWTRGTLDIHQINTGRGNCALFIFPDGTTLLVDVGDLVTRTERHVPARPDDSRSPAEWIGRYIKHVHPRGDEAILDYVLLTHFHGDHMGNVSDSLPKSPAGNYYLSGVTELAEYIPYRKVLDRGWPSYDFPSPLKGRVIENYRAFLEWQTANRGLVVERFQPGRNDQIVLLHSGSEFPDFEVRNITANGEVWTGVASETRQVFPPIETLSQESLPPENPCSCGFRLSYGKFDYFTGGDITGIPFPGGPRWLDVETPVAEAVGPVEVSLLDHHGYIDSQNEYFVIALRPRAWILPVWDSAHPTPSVYPRLRSKALYPGDRDIFTTNMHRANLVVTPGLDQLASAQGHILVRVPPDGTRFSVIILDDSTESFRVKAVHGPWEAR